MEVKDDAGYFFSRIGELCLTAESELQAQERRIAPKNLIVSSNRFGITAWADGKGAGGNESAQRHGSNTCRTRPVCCTYRRPLAAT